MKRCGELLFVVFLSLAFIFEPALSFGAEKKQENITINEQDMQNYLQTFKGVMEKYINELEKQGIKVDRERVEKELNNLLQFKGPLELKEKELNEYINKNKDKINEMVKDLMSKDPEQLGGNLGGLLGGLGGGAGGGLLGGLGGRASGGGVNSGAPGQIDSLMNMLGRTLGGTYEGFLFGGPLGAGLGVALGLAIDAGISMAVILGIAVIAGIILAIIVGIGALPISIIIGALAGAIIGALLFAVVAAVIFGGGTFLVVALTLILMPIVNIILAFVLAATIAVIVAFLAGIVGLIVGGVLGGILGLVAVPIAAIIGGVAGAGSGGLFGAVPAVAGQLIFIPLALFLGAIGFVLGLIGGPLFGGAAGLMNSAGMTTFSTTVKDIESYGDDYVNNIDKIVKNILSEAKKTFGPKSYNKIKSIEIIVDTADFNNADGINKATEEILNMIPSLAK